MLTIPNDVAFAAVIWSAKSCSNNMYLRPADHAVLLNVLEMGVILY